MNQNQGQTQALSPPPNDGTVATTEKIEGIHTFLRNTVVIMHQLEHNKSVHDLCSTYAVVAVFAASLGIAFITYAEATFSDRPAGTPAKITDHVVYIFWFLSIICAMASTMFLGAGSSQALTTKIHALKKEIRDAMNAKRREATTSSKHHHHFPAIIASQHNEQEQFPLLALLYPAAATSDDDRHSGFVVRGLHLLSHGIPGHFDGIEEDGKNADKEASVQVIPTSTTFVENPEEEIRTLHREEAYLANVVSHALASLAYSVMTLLAGLMVFIWAEHPRAVSIITTVELGILIIGWFRVALFSRLKGRLL